ncbi:hypothetical protein GCM10027277_57240 [Pseudoduganella ginsengisoli]|uniref:Uncharacterized protein n=1 Tax=Pseudoduganella ginsengisoli TaxID=1462440 RepID=A0A6L6Q268_9BURK|nr:hypothetical protein [Pseudoduganella ginsengisoli]MTW03606.1 hypothetical protein [Pseudoduganella ginsengisoli]
MGWLAILTLPASAVGAEYQLKLDGGAALSVEEKPFAASQHTLRDCHQSYKTCVVDGVATQGVVSEIRTELAPVTVSVGSKRYMLDTKGMFNPQLSEKDMPRSFGGFCYDENNCGFRALLGDAGGTYVAEWIIHNQVVTRTVLAADDDLIHLFRDHLSPTRYH